MPLLPLSSSAPPPPRLIRVPHPPVAEIGLTLKKIVSLDLWQKEVQRIEKNKKKEKPPSVHVWWEGQALWVRDRMLRIIPLPSESERLAVLGESGAHV